MPNDVSVSNLAGCRFMWFNKEVLDNFNLRSPYEYVEKNEWTIETFFNMVRGVSNPGTDGKLGVYGLANENVNLRNFMLTGIGALNVEYDEGGDLVCKIGTDYAEKTQDFFDQLKRIVDDPNVCIEFQTARDLDSANRSNYSDEFTHTRALFSQGHFLFVQTSMGAALRDFEDSRKGIGVVMNPKYNSDQKRYYHKIDDNAVIWAMPRDPNADTEMLGNVLDYWAWCSHGTVMEAYYELTLKTKRASDPVTAQMLDTVKDSIQYYILDLYRTDVSGFINMAYSSSVSSAWKTYSKKLPRDLKSLQQSIELID